MKGSPWTWRRFHSQSSYIPFAPALRSDIEFRIIGQYFIELNNLPVEFNFANYLNRLFLKYLAELGEVSPMSWFFMVVLVCINWFRAAVVDPTAQRPRCTNVPVSYYEHALDYAQWVTDINTFIVQPGIYYSISQLRRSRKPSYTPS